MHAGSSPSLTRSVHRVHLNTRLFFGFIFGMSNGHPVMQYTNGIVDFQQANCIGCGYCITGCPFDIPKMNPKNNRVFNGTLCTDRVSEGLEPACIKPWPT